MLPENMDNLRQSGASYDSEIRALEAVLRPLWGVLPLTGQRWRNERAEQCLERLLHMVRERKMPAVTRARRQSIVEAGVLAYGIGIFKGGFLNLLDRQDGDYLAEWLYSVNEVPVSENNWLFFYILINTALKVNGLKYSKQRNILIRLPLTLY